DTFVRERQRLDPGDTEIDLHMFARGFSTCDGDHLPRRVNAQDLTAGTDASASCSCQGTRPTADLEDGLAPSQVGKVNRPLSHESRATEREQRDHEVITRRPSDHVTMRLRVRLAAVTVTVSGGHAGR